MKPIRHKKTPFKVLNPNVCTLETTRIDVWSFALDTPLPSPGAILLSDEEQTRAKRFHFAHHQHHFTRARMHLRLVLARYLDTSPENLVFEYAEHGKPYLPKHPELHFNLSHSGTRALLAVGKTHPLGVDIEKFSDRPYEGIGSHVFSDEENAVLKTIHPSLKPMVFFNFWAQKEAFIKMLGLGLSYPTSRLTVPTFSSAHNTVFDPVYQSTSNILAFMPRLAYCAALCHHPSINNITYTELTHQESQKLAS